jgi:1-deoxy-D-xylulose-5-phosphate synthase
MSSAPLFPPSLEELRRMSSNQLQDLALKLRADWHGRAIGKKAHLQSSLCVTELSIALHAVFHTPEDVLIWDVGHQAYVHKWLTGRGEGLTTMRKQGGISGFPKRAESLHDAFGTGHSSTSISALAGMAHASRLRGERKKFVAVIGDGALTGGQSFEALNHAPELGADLLVVLNDNGRSLEDNVGILHRSGGYKDFFHSLGWAYHSAVDGHSIPELLAALKEVNESTGPRVLHVRTQHPADLIQPKATMPNSSGDMSFSQVFGETMARMLEAGEQVVVVSPAMLSAAHLSPLKKRFPQRVLDTGITEQHAVTLAAGMAASGIRVFCHLYSTFSQRAMDQIIHDVALQQLPVTFVLDRAGITGADGPTHHGVFDLALMRPIPNIELWDAQNGDMLSAILWKSLKSPGPVSVRIPRADTTLSNAAPSLDALSIFPKSGESKKARLYVGHALRLTPPDGFAGRQAILNRVKPLPVASLETFCEGVRQLEVWEDGSRMGGIGEQIAFVYSGSSLNVLSRSVPDRFIDHGDTDGLWKEIFDEA